VTITAQSSAGLGQAGLSVYAFNGTTYTGISGVTDDTGAVTLWLPAGDYRFRADQFGLQFYSADENHCSVPTCTTASVVTLGIQQDTVQQTITYTYDPLGRLTAADYDSGKYYNYTYDAVGNRLTQTTAEGTDTYTYMANNQLATVNGSYYGYDVYGNLVYDGATAYSYDSADRLISAYKISAYTMYTYEYDGLGDLMKETSMNYPTQETSTNYYTQDIAGGLSQVLGDGENLYAYGYNRISQIGDDTTGYFLDDILGSVRQVVDPDGEIVLGREYSPYGETISSTGDFDTDFGYTPKKIGAGRRLTDGTGLVNLRARYWGLPALDDFTRG
jgi:YD repeat-containing protein